MRDDGAVANGDAGADVAFAADERVVIDDNGLAEYKIIIQDILNNEFKDSLPPPNFKIIFEKYDPKNKYGKFVLDIIKDSVEFSKIGSPVGICRVI